MHPAVWPQSVPGENRGKNEKFAQNLRENCAENALKLRAMCASCAQIELKNPLKISEKLPECCA